MGIATQKPPALDGDCNPEACCFFGERDPDDRCLITVLSCCTIMDLLRAIIVIVILDMSDVTSYSDIEHIRKFPVAIGWEPDQEGMAACRSLGIATRNH